MKVQTESAQGELLTERIERFVRTRTGSAIRGLRIEVFGDSVVISGRASTYYSKQLATHAALDATGDRLNVCNEIIVI